MKPKSQFTRNVLTLMTGTTLAQAIPIAVSPILTRIYSPEDFGIFALFIAITGIFSSFVNGRYELAIMLPKKDEDAINIAALGIILTFVVSALLLIIIIIFNNKIIDLLESTEIKFWLYFIPLVVLLTGFWNVLNYFNIRKKKYLDISKAIIIKAVMLVCLQVIVGFLKNGPSGLISGQLVSQLFANTKLFLNIIKDKVLLSKISKLKIIALAKKYKDFPKYNAPATFSDTTALQLPSILLPKLYGFVNSGFFFLAHRMISLPSALIGKSISQVFFQEISVKKNMKSKCWPLFVNTVKRLFYIGTPISILIAILGPDIFEIVFGGEWRLSGEIARFLAIVFLFTFVVSPVSSVFSVSGYIKRGAFWKYLYLLTSLSIFIFSVFYGLDFFEFVILYTLHEVTLYIIYFYLIAKSVKQMDLETI